jgi:hypothetical protein
MSTARLSVAVTALLGLAGFAQAFVLVGSGPHTSTRAGDPLFGDGCRYVVVDTGTAVQPHASICRPI